MSRAGGLDPCPFPLHPSLSMAVTAQWATTLA